MHHALNTFPLTTAIAAGMRARVGGSLTIGRLPGMAKHTSPHPIDRGASR